MIRLVCACVCACAPVRLSLADNGLTDACMPALSEALRSAPLQKLFIYNNRLSDSGKSQLKAAWAQAGKSARPGYLDV